MLKEQVQQPSADELAARAAATKGLPASLLPGFHVTTRGDGWM